MKNINLKHSNYYFQKIILYLLIAIFIFLHNSKIAFSNDLNNIKHLNSPEKELATKYCDAINKKIFSGLNKEASLKYEYYFSSLKKISGKDHKIFFKNFKLKVMNTCSYKLTELEEKEFSNFIIEFLN